MSSRLRRKICLALISLAILSSFSCALITVKPVVDIPPRPELLVCEEMPATGATVQGDTVVMPLEDAIKLRDAIGALKACGEENVFILNGHIEKLENRLKA